VITGVGVAIPARNEAELTGACLLAVRRALAELPPRIDRAVCLVADRCTDDTMRIARSVFGGWSCGLVVRNTHDLSIGEVRDLGIRQIRTALHGHAPEHVLLLNTDADTTVAPDWARSHVARAEKGSHAVAGTADLSPTTSLPPHAQRRYRDILDEARRPEGHGTVYGANLGLRADAYAAVGGFGALHTGEDHDLWRRLGRAGYRRCYDPGPTVVTSARLSGRAEQGLADLLRTLHDQESFAGLAPPAAEMGTTSR
jgi:cellulose synthase/poly-beta-1,6-N-acetylglucosamine synthase-like glycosyltransferase